METKETKYLSLKTNIEIPVWLAIEENENGITVTILDPTLPHPALEKGEAFKLSNQNEMTFAFKKVPNPDHIDAALQLLEAIGSEIVTSINSLTTLKAQVMTEEK